MLRAFDERAIDRISARVNEAIDLAAIGKTSWEQVAEVFSRAFPGSIVAINSMDYGHGRTNFEAAYNWDPDLRALYYKHYGYLNPWIEFWKPYPSGSVLIANEIAPACSFRGTEFFDDWFVRHGDIEGATGLLLDIDRFDQVMIPVHYPLSYSDRYDTATAAVLKRIRGAMARAIRIARRIGEAGERLVAASALVGRFREAAIVVGRDMSIRDTNDTADREFASGQFIRGMDGRLSLVCPVASERLKNCIRCMACDVAVDGSSFDAVYQNMAWRISFTRLPLACSPGDGLLIRPRHQYLVLIRNLTATLPAHGTEAFARLHELTPSETRLCELITSGVSLSQAAERLAITNGTAKQRLKAIFEKTGTHRQGQLIGLMARFG